MADDASGPVRVWTLDKHHAGSGVLYRLKQGWRLVFRLGPSLLGRQVQLWCNAPERGVPFRRAEYRPLPWQTSSANEGDDTGRFATLALPLSGSFHFYLTSRHGAREIEGYVVVDPEITVGRANKTLPLDGLQCQSVLTKHLGAIGEWEGRLKVAHISGYNMIHFTPLQVVSLPVSCLEPFPDPPLFLLCFRPWERRTPAIASPIIRRWTAGTRPIGTTSTV